MGKLPEVGKQLEVDKRPGDCDEDRGVRDVRDDGETL